MAATSAYKPRSLRIFPFFRDLQGILLSRWPMRWQSRPEAPPSDELYLALYARLKDPQTYHYALHISPKQETTDPMFRKTTKFHSKNILQSTEDAITMPWIHEAFKISSNHDNRLLVRVLLGELSRKDVVERLFAEVPVVQDDPDFNCITWVRQALLGLHQVNIIRTGIKFDWDNIQKTALAYVDKKKQQGRFETSWEGDSSRVATFDMMLSREIFP